jgi:hypothetical protein
MLVYIAFILKCGAKLRYKMLSNNVEEKDQNNKEELPASPFRIRF